MRFKAQGRICKGLCVLLGYDNCNYTTARDAFVRREETDYSYIIM